MQPSPPLAQRVAMLAYGLACYAAFLAVFLYAIGFTGGGFGALGLDHPALRAMETGRAPGPIGASIAIDALLLAVFAGQPSGMARPAFKRAWTRLVPEAIERSTYVLLASACLALLFWQWRPLGTEVVWDLSGSPAGMLVVSLSIAGWLTVLVATFLIDHFELFGLRQVWLALRGRAARPPDFRTPALYRAVRHPIYLGFLTAFWATPRMTLGHLLFAVGTTAYVLVAIQLEEHDLVVRFGDSYRRYRLRTPMLLPFGARRAVERPVEPVSDA